MKKERDESIMKKNHLNDKNVSQETHMRDKHLLNFVTLVYSGGQTVVQ